MNILVNHHTDYIFDPRDRTAPRLIESKQPFQFYRRAEQQWIGDAFRLTGRSVIPFFCADLWFRDQNSTELSLEVFAEVANSRYHLFYLDGKRKRWLKPLPSIYT